MSHVWTLTACRALPPHAAPATPLLHLFNGFARSCGSAARQQYPVAIQGRRQQQYSVGRRQQDKSVLWRRHVQSYSAFSTSAPSSARARRPPPLSSPPKSNPHILAHSKLQPAPTVASHTEGLPLSDAAEREEEEGEVGLTWRDYDPVGGMPLPHGELSQPQIDSIFGKYGNVDEDTGNYILSVMHWRRISGALIDSGLDFPKGSGITREQALKGLQYVRTLVPGFDEQEAGQRWVEEESVRLQEEIRQRSVALGIYKKDNDGGGVEAEVDVEPESEQGTAYGRQRTGESALQTHRLEQEAKWEAEQAAKAARKQREELAALHSQRGPLELAGGIQPTVALTATGSGDITITGPQTKAWLQPVERKPWVKYYEEQASIIKDNVVPRLSLFRRLGPSFLLTLAVVGMCVFVANNYIPPPRSARIFPETPPAVATLGTITAMLVAGFVFGRIPPLWRTYSKYLTIVPAYPYATSLIGAQFRHDTLAHLTTNVITLWLFGLLLHEDVGRGTFLSIFLGSGIVGGFSSLAYNVLRKQWASYIFGSSGCVIGVVAAACTLRPNGTVKVMGYEIPVAAWVFLAFYGVGEVVAMARGMRLGIDHAGHLGGMVAGVGSTLYLKAKVTSANAGDIGQEMQRTSADGATEEVAIRPNS